MPANRPGQKPVEVASTLYFNYGFTIIPVRKDGSKKPCLPGWKEYQTSGIDEELIEDWDAKYPGCNWGIICGAKSDLFVFDADDADAIKWAEQHLPKTPMTVSTGKGRHYYFRFPSDKDDAALLKRFNPKKLNPKVNADMRGEGSYVVAPGSVHENGKTYILSEYVDWEIVPEFALRGVAIPGEDSLSQDLGVDMSNAVRDIEGDVPQSERNNTLFRAVMTYLDETRPRPKDDEVYKHADTWNKEHCKPPLEYEEVRRTAKSAIDRFNRKRIFEKSKAVAKGAFSMEAAADLDGVRYLEGDELNTVAEIPVPEVLLHLPGNLGILQKYIMDSSVQTTPLFAAVGALMVMSVAAGFKVSSSTGLVTNNYFVCVGASSCGKNAPKSAFIRLMSKFAPRFLGGNDVSSDAALLNRLTQKDRHICGIVVDEFGQFLKGCMKPNSPRYNFSTCCTQLFSATRDRTTKIYADAANNKVLLWHCMSLLGLTTPGEFFEAMRNGSATNGFLARQLVFIDDNVKPLPRKEDILLDIPPEVEKLMNTICAEWTNFKPVDTSNKASLDDMPQEEHGMPIPVICRCDEEAKAILRKADQVYREKNMEYTLKGADMEASICGRFFEHTNKLALVFHFSKYPDSIDVNTTITADVMQDAVDVANFAVGKLLQKAALTVSNSDFEAVQNIILQTILRDMSKSKTKADRGKDTNGFVPGSTDASISNATAAYPSDIVNKAIEKLVRRNIIRYQEGFKTSEKSRRPLNIYRFVIEEDD